MSMLRTWADDDFRWENNAFDTDTLRKDLLLGDCFSVYPDIPTDSVDLILTDPPYGTTRNEWDTKAFRETLESTWREWLRIAKECAPIVVMAASPFDKILAMSQIKYYRYEWIWHKNKATGHLNSAHMPMRAHENILVFYRQAGTYNAQHTHGHAPCHGVNAAKMPQSETPRNYGHFNRWENPDGCTSRTPRTVLNVAVHQNGCQEKWHPTQKPVRLMEYLVRTYTNPSDVVFDPYAGSATTGAAALRQGRHFVGIEMDAEYHAAATNRLNRLVARMSKDGLAA